MAAIDGAVMRQGGDAGEPASERIVIWPHRSLGRRGMIVLLAVVGAVFAAIAIWAIAFSAWPLLFYAVLALGGFALALWCNTCAARMAQVIEFAPDVIRVSETGPASTRPVAAEFNPVWVRVVDAVDPRVGHRLILRQSGRSIEIGDFLSPSERSCLAAELRDRIAIRYRRMQ
jgi:uncharacterized membrane protein